MRATFANKSDAERRIAERGKAGKLKPVHLPGRHWLLTANREGTISRSQLFHVLAVKLEKLGINRTAEDINRQANEIWRQAQEAA